MNKLSNVLCQTRDEIEVAIEERKLVAAMLPSGKTRQSVLADIERLRSYAEMKRYQHRLMDNE